VTRWHEQAPGEREAEDRSWPVVRAAFATRIPVPRRRARWPLFAAAAAAAIVAATLSPPGLAVLGSIRDAVRGEPNAKPALFSLPTGRLLVDSTRGVWVVERDGSKRLLAGYRDASWSPHGLFLAAVSGDELRALEPDGDVHWSIGRPRLRFPRWSDAGHRDERIAYLSGKTLRVVGGDSRGDHVVGTALLVAPAWRPGTHTVAYVDRRGRVAVVDADSGHRLWARRAQQAPAGLGWSADGRFLLAWGASSITVFGGVNGAVRLEPLGPGAAPVADATFSGSGNAVAFVQEADTRSVLWVYPTLRPDGTAARRVFTGAGVFDRVLWSPNGRWLLLSWPSADQWLFLRSAAVRKLEPVSGIASAFGAGAVPADWCCG
jgi:dipeptidyl aminopeptidase/acylaminoacyl peptidase